MRAYNHSEDDVLIMGSDGFWDVTSNEQAVMIARECLQQFKPADKSRSEHYIVGFMSTRLSRVAHYIGYQ